MNNIIVLCDSSTCGDLVQSGYEVTVLCRHGQQKGTANTTSITQVSKDISCSSGTLWKILCPYVFKLMIFLLRYLPNSFLDSITAYTILYPFSNMTLGKYYISALRSIYGCEAHTLSAYQFIYSFLPAQGHLKRSTTCNPTGVILYTSIKSIEYANNEVKVCVTLSSGEDASFCGSSVIVATSPLTWKDLSLQPPLPAPLLSAFRNITTGDYYSANISYSKSHRHVVTVGALHLISDCNRGPICSWQVAECCDDTVTLRATAGGIPTQLLSQLSLKQRRELILQQLAHEFGDEYVTPDEFVDSASNGTGTSEDGWHEVTDPTYEHCVFPTGVISVLQDAPLPNTLHFAHADIGFNNVMSTLRRVANERSEEPSSSHSQRFLFMMSFGFGVAVVFSSLLYIAMLIFPSVFGSSNITVLQDTCTTNAMN